MYPGDSDRCRNSAPSGWLVVRAISPQGLSQLVTHAPLKAGTDHQKALRSYVDKLKAAGWRLELRTDPLPHWYAVRDGDRRQVSVDPIDPTLPPDAPQQWLKPPGWRPIE